MAEDYGKWLEDLEKQNKIGSGNRASNLEKLQGTNPDDVDRVKEALIAQYQRRGAAPSGVDSSVLSAQGYGSGRGETRDDTSSSSSGSANTWLSGGRGGGSSGSSAMPDYSKYFEQQNQYLQQMQTDAQARNAQITEREKAQQAQRDTLYGTLLNRAQQSTNVDPNDPIIKGQVQSFQNAQDRSQRNYLSDLAERSGPLANLRGEQRMTAERSGINTANYQSDLLARELTAKRAEISDALNSMRGMLTNDQQANLQRELNNLDNQLGQVSAGFSGGAAYGGLGNDLMRAMLQNSQFYAGLGSENDRFAAQHGLNVADRASYWDSLRRGLLD